jgi:hypothetical protein
MADPVASNPNNPTSESPPRPVPPSEESGTANPTSEPAGSRYPR